MTSRYVATALAAIIAFVLFALMVTGCGAPAQLPDNAPFRGAAIRGSVHGGQQPVSGAHVYLLAANTTGYGNASVSLLNSADTGNSDSVGAYVLTGSDGSFGIGGDYTCTPGQQAYLYAHGGNPGAGTNSSAGFMAVLGNCPSADNFATATPTVQMNEVTTVAAAYAIAGYAYAGDLHTGPTYISSSGSTLGLVGIKNAFANAANLVDISTGTARSTTLGGNGTVPAQTIYTLANILAACVNTADVTVTVPFPHTSPSAACSTLSQYATSGGNQNGNNASDTAGAAINIAHFPADSVDTLYNLPNGNYAFGDGLTTEPADFSLSLTFTGGGMRAVNQPAVDASGNVWIADRLGPGGSGGLVELSSLGAILSPSSSEWTDGSLDSPDGIVLDTSGNAWLANANGHTISEFNSSGVFQTTASAPGNALLFPKYMGFDASGNLWVDSTNNTTNSLMKFSSSGSYTATYTGNGLTSQLFGLAIDHSGNVWLSNGSSVSEFSNSGGTVGNSPFTTGLSNPVTVALDSSSRLWVLNFDASVTLLNSSGGVVSGTPYNTGGSAYGSNEVIDGAGSDWIITSTFSPPFNQTYGLIAISSTGTQIFSNSSSTLSFNGYGANGLAIDGSGDVWVTGGPQVVEFIGAATPVVTPMAANLVSPYSAPASQP